MVKAASHRAFIADLRRHADPAAVEKVSRFFYLDAETATSNRVLGVSLGRVFPVAKAHAEMPVAEIEKLLESPYYEVRMGAVSIMDFQARSKRTDAARRKALFELYIRRHDRINNWDLVDRAAPHVVGGYLHDKPRDLLLALARSKNPWRRRTAIVSTYYFIRAGQTKDTFRIAEVLVRDRHPLVQKAVGSWLREAGKKDAAALLAFLEKFADAMPRPMLRYAVEKLPARQRARFRR